MPLLSTLMLLSCPGAKPSCVMLVTPKPVPYSVALLRSSWTLGMGSVAAPAALVDAGMLMAMGVAGEVGADPLGGKVIVATGAGVPALLAMVVPLAVTNTFQVSVAAFWK